MGKRLIIKGADFSANAVNLPHHVLDWIASSGTDQAFNTNVLATQKMRIEVELSATQAIIQSTSTTEMGIVGSGIDTSSALGIKYIPNYTCYAVSSENTQIYVSGCKFADTDRHVLSIDQTEFLIDGVQKKALTEGTINATDYPIYLMGINKSGARYTYFHIHSVKIFSDRDDNDSLIHHYVPVMKKDGTICMYDKVTDTYLYVSGSGTPDYGA